MKTDPFSTVHWKPFLLLQTLAVLLLASWFWQTTYPLWLEVDYHVFHTLNGSLTWHHGWQVFWALCNCRPFDGLVLILFLLTVLCPNWVFSKNSLKRVFILLAATSVAALFIRYGMKFFFDIKRSSPSLIVHDALRLRDLIPSLPAKDQSHGSFPGDHATLTLVWWMIVMLYTHKKAWRYRATFIAFLILLPRLVAGAHWLTDDLIGGLFVALLAVAWVCFTPLHRVAYYLGLPILNLLIKPLEKIKMRRYSR